MAAFPELAPHIKNRLLSSISVVQHTFYRHQLSKYYYLHIGDAAITEMHYTTYDIRGTEKIRMTKKPAGVLFDNKPVVESNTRDGYLWKPLTNGGTLIIDRDSARLITILR